MRKYITCLLTLGAHAQRGLQYFVCEYVFVCLSVCSFVCYHVFCNDVQRNNKIAIPTGSLLHWLHFDFRITVVLKSYGVKTK